MNATALEVAAAQLSQVASDIQASRYLTVAGFVVLVYDHMLTLSDEMELVWRKPLSVVSALFLINRYTVPLFVSIDVYDKGGLSRNLPISFCRHWFWTETNLQVVSFAITHALVALRVRALWGNKPWAHWCIIAMGSTYFISTLIINNLMNSQVTPSLYWDTLLNLCFGTLPRWASLTFAPALAFESGLVGLTLAKAIKDRRQDLTTSSVAAVLYRDGILYFFVIASCSVFNIIDLACLRPSLAALARYFSFSFVNVMSSRLVLNLKALGRDEGDGLVASGMSGLSVGGHYPQGPDYSFGGRDLQTPMSMSVSSNWPLQRIVPSTLRTTGGTRLSGSKAEWTTSPYKSRKRSVLSAHFAVGDAHDHSVSHGDAFYLGNGGDSYELHQLGTKSVRVQVKVDVAVKHDSDDEQVSTGAAA